MHFKRAMHKYAPGQEHVGYQDFKLLQEVYQLILVMSIFTKRGGPWHNTNSPGWPDRSQRAVEMMEEIWM
jgi:hypothetical protein